MIALVIVVALYHLAKQVILGVAAHPLEELPLEDWRKVLDVNLTGPFLCSRELVRRIGDARAVIVNNSSVHEQIPWPGFSHYCASKGGLKLFAQTIARELAPRGIRVVSVAPGATQCVAGASPRSRNVRAERKQQETHAHCPEAAQGLYTDTRLRPWREHGV